MSIVDTSELRTLAADLSNAPKVLGGQVLPVVHRGANNIKRQLRTEMGQSRHFGQIVPFIDYEILGGSAFGKTVIAAEIGPRAERAGLLENIAYFGTSRGGGTVPDPQNAADAEAPKFADALADLAAKAALGS